jgi:hypothetical protein
MALSDARREREALEEYSQDLQKYEQNRPREYNERMPVLYQRTRSDNVLQELENDETDYQGPQVFDMGDEIAAEANKKIARDKERAIEDAARKKEYEKKEYLNAFKNIDTSNHKPTGVPDNASLTRLQPFVYKLIEQVKTGDPANLSNVYKKGLNNEEAKIFDRVRKMLKNPKTVAENYKNNIWVPHEVTMYINNVKRI